MVCGGALGSRRHKQTLTFVVQNLTPQKIYDPSAFIRTQSSHRNVGQSKTLSKQSADVTDKQYYHDEC